MTSKKKCKGSSCDDCHEDTSMFGGKGDFYWARDDVWAQATEGKKTRFLCLDCLGNRLGRPVVAEDLRATPWEVMVYRNADYPKEWAPHEPPRMRQFRLDFLRAHRFNLRKVKEWLCDDCSVDTSMWKGNGHCYVAHDAVWSQAGAGGNTILCLDCLEGRLGRPIVAEDLFLTPWEMLRRQLLTGPGVSPSDHSTDAPEIRQYNLDRMRADPPRFRTQPKPKSQQK
jgi:hypothetical protein